MLELTVSHLDDFTLLRYAVGDLDDLERVGAERHLGACRLCSAVLEDVRRLDAELRLLAKDAGVRTEWEQIELPPGDPFRRRPLISAPSPDSRADGLAALALAASERAGLSQQRILDATPDPKRLASLLGDLDLGDAASRFALLYALQEAGREIAGSPARALLFAGEVLARLRREPSADNAGRPEAERIVPRLALLGQAHVLAGQACIWTREFERARSHLEVAYRAFASGGGDEVSLAIVEYHESQRRSFLSKGHEGRLLARRAAATFQALGLDDLFARAKVSEGLALFDLDRQEEAVGAYRLAIPIFEQRSLWSNYVGAVNSVGTSLLKLGRLDDARREYARALRRVSRERHGSWVGYIRVGLARVLLSGDRCREAALSFSQAARLFAKRGLFANSLTASLFEIESWARSGDLDRARHRLEIFRTEVARHRALDYSVTQQVDEALSGANPDFERLAQLRQQAEAVILERLQGASA